MSIVRENVNCDPDITDDESDLDEISDDECSGDIVEYDSFDKTGELYSIDDSLAQISTLSIREDQPSNKESNLSQQSNASHLSNLEDEISKSDDNSFCEDLPLPSSLNRLSKASSDEQRLCESPMDSEEDDFDVRTKSRPYKSNQNISHSPQMFFKKKVNVIQSDSENDESLLTEAKIPQVFSKKKISVIQSDSENDESLLAETKKEKSNCSLKLSEARTPPKGSPNVEEVNFSVPTKLSAACQNTLYSSQVFSKKKINVIQSDSEDDTSLHTIDKEKYSKSPKLSKMRTPIKEVQNHAKADLKSSDSSMQFKREPLIDFTKESMLTPRTKLSSGIDSDSSVEEFSDGIIEVSSEDEPETPRKCLIPKTMGTTPLPSVNKSVIRQVTLDSLVKKMQGGGNNVSATQNAAKGIEDDPNAVSPEQHQKQADKVRQLESDLQKAKNLLRTLNITALPDKGELLIKRHKNLENALKLEKEKLGKMVVKTCDGHHHHHGGKHEILSWEQIQAGASAVMPKTFGKKGLSTYNAQKALTLDRLEQLHSSLKGRPKDNAEATDPRGLKVELMPHQKRALAWMMWRENQKPSGGILADDMGLGKTLTLISLMLKMKEGKENDDDDDSGDDLNKHRKNSKYPGGTLVVCPASLLNQWSGELESKAKRGLASFEVYHGPKRETHPKRLAEHDMVITTYAIIMNECEKNGAVFRVRWKRIILDEAHQIRNHKSQTSEAVCKLAAKSRWALTGTPIHNKELDMYALLKFLRCTPFDDLAVWKRWVGDKSTGGQERLHTVISSLLLRRTKAELMENGSLQCLPHRHWELITVTLEKQEMDVYSKVLLFSKSLFAQFLHQRAEKNQDRVDFDYKNYKGVANDPNSEYFKMRQHLLKFNKIGEVKQHEILVLLLRLRQICCHPTLITNMLNGDEDLGAEESSENIEEMNLIDQINRMNLDDHSSRRVSGIAQEEVGLREACKNILNPSNPVFSDRTRTSKIKIIVDVLKRKVLAKNDKAIVVSQWTSLLKVVALHLEREGIRFDQLDGTVPVNKRMGIVNNVNDPNSKVKILLLSLTAGGVGLNLVGANHLLLLDLHWNPQLENQAQDRIYRVGQKKPVHIYKFMAVGTIEERIKGLQDKKLEIAESMLTGTKQVISNKLSLNDLKMLFEM